VDQQFVDKLDDDAGNDTTPGITDGNSMACGLFKKAVQQGRSERRGESYSVPYVEPLSDARTMLAGFVNSLLRSVATIFWIGCPTSDAEGQARRSFWRREESKPLGLFRLRW